MHGKRSPNAEAFDDASSLTGKEQESTMEAITVYTRAIPATKTVPASTQVTSTHLPSHHPARLRLPALVLTL